MKVSARGQLRTIRRALAAAKRSTDPQARAEHAATARAALDELRREVRREVRRLAAAIRRIQAPEHLGGAR